MPEREKIAVVGPGAMGCLFAARLAGAGHEVWVVDHRPERAQLLSQQGIIISAAEGEERFDVKATAQPEAVGQTGLVVLCVKAYDTRAAALFVRPLVGSATDVLSLQNGLGNAEILAEVFGPERVLAGTTAQGANLLAPGHVRHAGRGETVIGQMDGKTERAEKSAALFSAAGLPAAVTTNLSALLWSKLVVNAAINPLTALLGVRNGVLAELEPARALMQAVVEEIKSVCATKGIRLLHDDPDEKVLAVARATAENISSMLADVRAKRRTEAAYINGAVVREAATVGLSAPVNETLARLMEAREQSYQLRVEEGGKERG